MQREVILQDLILYSVQSLSQSVGLLFYLSSSSPGKRMLTILPRTSVWRNYTNTHKQYIRCANSIINWSKLYNLCDCWLYSWKDCTDWVFLVFTNLRLLELLTVAWIYWSSSMKMCLLIEDEPNKQMKNQLLLLVFLDLRQVVLQLIANCLYCTILSQDNHPGKRTKTVNKTILHKNTMHFKYSWVFIFLLSKILFWWQKFSSVNRSSKPDHKENTVAELPFHLSCHY